MDLLKTWYIRGIPPDHKKPLYLQEYEVQESGSAVTWGVFSGGMDILALAFPTKKEADGVRSLVAGTMTDKDFEVLSYIYKNPNLTLDRISKSFKGYKDIGDILGKLIRTNNIYGKHVFNIAEIGIDTLEKFKKGFRDMSTYKIKVVSMAQVLEDLNAKKEQLNGMKLG